MAGSVNLAQKTFVVTGGNSGIGLETARALVHKNAHVVIASRNWERGDAAVQELKQEAPSNAKVDCMQLDLASFRSAPRCCACLSVKHICCSLFRACSSIREFADAFEKRNLPLHALVSKPPCTEHSSTKPAEHPCSRIKRTLVTLSRLQVNNAGVFMPPDARTEEDFEIQLGVNHFGPFYLTHLLLNNLEQSAPSRIVNLGYGKKSYHTCHMCCCCRRYHCSLHECSCRRCAVVGPVHF